MNLQERILKRVKYMYENEKQRSTHLLILLVYTFLTVALIGESFLMGWDRSAIVLMIIALAVCWGIHIGEKIQAAARMWIYFTFSMLTCFFYGIHETSVFDLVGLMVVIIILFSFAVLFQLVTLPVEFNASSRALRLLSDNGILYDGEVEQTKKVLSAAAMTYVASAATAIIQLARLLLLRGRNRD